MKLEEVTQNDREKTKRVVYAVVYGVGRCLMKDRKFLTVYQLSIALVALQGRRSLPRF